MSAPSPKRFRIVFCDSVEYVGVFEGRSSEEALKAALESWNHEGDAKFQRGRCDFTTVSIEPV